MRGPGRLIQSHIEAQGRASSARRVPIWTEFLSMTSLDPAKWLAILSPLLALIAIVLIWLLSLPMVNVDQMTDVGLVSVLPVWTFLALFLLVGGFAFLVYRRDTPETILLLYVLTFIMMIHGTPQILYGTVRYAWTWKHVGIIDYIQRHGTVDPYNVGDPFQAYHNWPGFFALNALITDVSGLKTALRYAGWGPVFFNVLDLGAILMIFKTLTRDRRLIWLSVLVFFIGNWVGQDYFSPQAMAFFLYLVAVGILLKWFRARSPDLSLPDAWRGRYGLKARFGRWLLAGRLAFWYRTAVSRAVPEDDPGPGIGAWGRTGLMAIVILSMMVIVSSHQLTPVVMISTVALLALFQVTNARGLPLLMAVLTVGWIVYFATPFLQGHLSWIADSFGTLFGNFSSGLVNMAGVSEGQVLVSWMDRGLSASVWLLGLVGSVRRLRRGHWDLAAVLLALAPLVMLAANSYGGEIIFRVYLFGLAFVSFFVAAIWYATPTSGTSWRTPVTTALVTCLLLVGFLFSYYGKEHQYHFSPQEVQAANYLLDVAPRGSLIVDGVWNWPWDFKNYEFYDRYTLGSVSIAERKRALANPVSFVRRLMLGYPMAYLVITSSQKAIIDETGKMPRGSLDTIEQALEHSPSFEVVYSNRDAKIFILAPSVRGGTP